MAEWGDRQKKTPPQRRRVQNRLRRRRVIRLFILFFLGGGLLVGIWYGTRANLVTITTVHIEGAKTIDQKMIEQEVQTILNGSYLFLVPKRFSYTYPHDQIIDTLGRLPRVAETKVERTSHSVLSVALVEYTPYALWCREDARPEEPCLYISKDGLAFASAPSLRGATFLRYMTTNRKPEVGATLASFDYVQATKEFAQVLLDRHRMYVSAIIETSDGDVRYQIRGGGELLVSKNANMQEVFENLEAILVSEEFKHIESGKFVYIDLRFGDKVFVKEFPDKPKAESEGFNTDDTETTD